MSKKRHLSDSQVLARIEQGDFNVERIDLVRNSENGEIVKHMKRRDTDTVPSTYVQVNNNYVVERDITPFIDALVKHRDSEAIAHLEDGYEVVLGYLAYYRDHLDRLDLLNSESLRTTLVFKSRMKGFLVSAEEFLRDNNGLRNVQVVDAYLNTLFIYVISTHKLHKTQLSRDTNSREQLELVKNKLLSIYKDLMMAGSGEKYDLLRSGYARILNDKDYDLDLLDSLIRHDDRFVSSMAFIKDLRDKSQETKGELYSTRYSFALPDNNKWGVKYNIDIASKLVVLLDKVENIETIIVELCTAGELDEAEVEFDSSALNLPFSLFKLTHQKQPDA